MLAVLDEGRLLARRLGEPWWALFFDFWRTEAVLHYLRDYRGLLDQALRVALEMRKPAFEQHPLRFASNGHLVGAYLYIDARGYGAEIAEALAWLGRELPEVREEGYVLQARKASFAEAMGRPDEALALAHEGLALTEGDPNTWNALHHRCGWHATLCRLHFLRGDWPALAETASAGEELARRRQGRKQLALFLLCRALTARREHRDDQEATRLFRAATAQAGRLGSPPGEPYFDALAAFHELAGELVACWGVRQQELATIGGRGLLAAEADLRIKRVRLLARLGRALDDELAAARAAIARLRAPAYYLDRLAAVAAAP